MNKKMFLLLTLIIAVKGSVIPQHYISPVPAPYVLLTDDTYNDNPQYTYSYDINDPSTGDIKNQQESRSGNTVQGQYSLVEPDGMRRTVNYASDPVHGFSAVIRRDSIITPSQSALDPHVQTTTTPHPTTTTTQEPVTEMHAPVSPAAHVSRVDAHITRGPVHQPTIIAHPSHYIAPSALLIPNTAHFVSIPNPPLHY